MHGVEVGVEGEEPDGPLAALHGDAVDLAALLAHAGGEHIAKVLAEEEWRAELLGGGLEARRHVDVGGKVGGVNLVLRSYGSLDRPADVQPKPHLRLQQARHTKLSSTRACSRRADGRSPCRIGSNWLGALTAKFGIRCCRAAFCWYLARRPERLMPAMMHRKDASALSATSSTSGIRLPPLIIASTSSIATPGTTQHQAT
eukprot:scaffold2903_cov336-Prasinococcus_capsulatus_cf.AAC.3